MGVSTSAVRGGVAGAIVTDHSVPELGFTKKGGMYLHQMRRQFLDTFSSDEPVLPGRF